jgi:hypothetical protein
VESRPDPFVAQQKIRSKKRLAIWNIYEIILYIKTVDINPVASLKQQPGSIIN